MLLLDGDHHRYVNVSEPRVTVILSHHEYVFNSSVQTSVLMDVWRIGGDVKPVSANLARGTDPVTGPAVGHASLDTRRM